MSKDFLKRLIAAIAVFISAFTLSLGTVYGDAAIDPVVVVKYSILPILLVLAVIVVTIILIIVFFKNRRK